MDVQTDALASANRSTADLYDDWFANQRRRVLLVDETRAPTRDDERECVVFYCVVLSAGYAYWLSSEMDAVRIALCERDATIKAGDLLRPENVVRYRDLLNLAREALLESRVAFCTVTTQFRLDQMQKAKHRARFTVIGNEGKPPTVVKGKELLVPMLMVREATLRQGYGEEQVDVVFDRSQRLGFDRGTRRLSTEGFEVFGPGRLERGPDGRPLTPPCNASFRFIAGGDNVKHLRDLLLLPELLGFDRREHDLDAYRRTIRGTTEPMWFRQVSTASGA